MQGTNKTQAASILVVEDNEDTREVLLAFLEMKAYRAIPANNGKEALEYLRRESAPDLIILDWWMPVMDGLHFRREQMKDPRLEMTQFNGQMLTYDDNGNLTYDGTYTYGWDTRNRLASKSISGSSSSFVYDAFGRRVSVSTDGEGGGNTSSTYLYDGLNAVKQASTLGGTANMLTGLSLDELYTRTDSNGTVSFLTDDLGSTLGLVGSGQSIGTSYTYEPFGNTTISGNFSANSNQYVGRENDGTLYYMRGRYYSATMQRFISQDPIRFLGGVNLYSYVYNDPIDFSDPSGLFDPWIHYGITEKALNGTSGFPSGLPEQVAKVDFLPGSQDPANAFWHAMRDGLNGQTPEQAEKLFNDYVAKQIESCTSAGLARALHAVQDSAARGHKGFQPYSGLLSLPLEHLLGDAFPTNAEYQEGVTKSVEVLNRYKKRCPSCGPKK